MKSHIFVTTCFSAVKQPIKFSIVKGLPKVNYLACHWLEWPEAIEGPKNLGNVSKSPHYCRTSLADKTHRSSKMRNHLGPNSRISLYCDTSGSMKALHMHQPHSASSQVG
jgi:hypothetical protein